MKISNECRIDYSYKHGPLGPIIKDTIISNRVLTIVIDDALAVTKSSDKVIVSLFEIFHYFIEISNISSNTINNISFIDSLPEGIVYINNSLYINDILCRGLTPEKEISLGELKSKESIFIRFKVLVNKVVKSKTIINHCTSLLDFIYDIDKPPIKIPINSNDVITLEKDDLFKQIIVQDEIVLPMLQEDMENISIAYSRPLLLECKILSPCSKINSHSLLILGSMSYNFRFNYHHSVYKVPGTLGFSTILKIPEGIHHYNKAKALILVEDISYSIIHSRKLLLYATLLVKIYS